MLGDTSLRPQRSRRCARPTRQRRGRSLAAFPDVAALALSGAGTGRARSADVVDGQREARDPRIATATAPRSHRDAHARHKARGPRGARPLAVPGRDKPGLSQRRVRRARRRSHARVLDAGLGPALRAAILHLDIAKTARRARTRARGPQQGISLEVHNEAARRDPARGRSRAKLGPARRRSQKLAVAWVEAHGLAGQHVRGEGPILMFAPLVAALRELAPALGRDRSRRAPRREYKRRARIDGLHVLNACDTAAVREGLLDDALLGKLARVRDQLDDGRRAAAVDGSARRARRARAAARSRARSPIGCARCAAGRQHAGEPAAAVDAAVAALGDTRARRARPALADVPALVLRSRDERPVTRRAARRARGGRRRRARKIGVDVARPWHAQLRPLSHACAATARRFATACASSRRRSRSAARASCCAGDGEPRSARHAVGAARASATDPDAIVVDYVDTEESAALVTLLGLYETRSQVAFHQMLKALCDLVRPAQGRVRPRRQRGELPRVDERGALRQGAHARLRPARPHRRDRARRRRRARSARERGSPTAEIDRRRSVAERSSRRSKAARAPATHRWRVVLGAAEALPELVPAARVDTRRVLLDPPRGLLVHRARRPQVPPRERARRHPRRVRHAAPGWPHRDPRRRDAAARHAAHSLARARRARDASISTSRSSRAARSSSASSPPTSRRAVVAPTRWSFSTRTRGARRASRTRCASSTASCRTTTTSRARRLGRWRDRRARRRDPRELRSYLQPGYRDNLARQDRADRRTRSRPSSCPTRTA